MLHRIAAVSMICALPSVGYGEGACDGLIHTWIDVSAPLWVEVEYPLYGFDHSDVGDTDAQDWYMFGVAVSVGFQTDFEDGAPLPKDAEAILMASEGMTNCLAMHPSESYDPVEMIAWVKGLEEEYPRQDRLDFIEAVRKQ